MNQTCPHCQALVILPELVRNYGDMPIQCHDCENSFFLPTDQLSKTSGGVVRHRCRSCKLAVYLPKMKQISAPLPVRIAHHPCQPTLGGVYQAGAAFFWPFALGFSLARSGFNWSQPLW